MIVLKEGQGLILIPETDSSVVVGASVVDGRLTIAEIDPDVSNFGVTWNSAGSWETSAMIREGSGRTTVFLDQDGDGLPNLKIEVPVRGGETRRFELDQAIWKELSSDNDRSESDG